MNKLDIKNDQSIFEFLLLTLCLMLYTLASLQRASTKLDIHELDSKRMGQAEEFKVLIVVFLKNGFSFIKNAEGMF